MPKLGLLLVCAVTAFGASAAYAGCGSLQSSASSQPADIKFVNKTKGPVTVSWYLFGGGLRTYKTLAPSQSYVQATFTNHVWALTDAKAKCLSTLVVHKSRVFNIR